MLELNKKPIVIGVGGFARSGKDTFVKIARKILSQNGMSSKRLAFADALKEEMDPFLKQHYGISAWTDNTEEKTIIRPFLVAHGCGKRLQTKGKHWIDKLEKFLSMSGEDVIFISDCRFPNEVDWVHDWEKLRWSGWFVHLKKYTNFQLYSNGIPDGFFPKYDDAPNAEEAENDPICEKNADYKLELENVIERELRLTGNRITADSLIDNQYLNDEIKLCLTKCPFLTIK